MCHQNGSAIQKATGAQRSLLDDEYNMASRKLRGPADLTKTLFYSLLHNAFNWELQRWPQTIKRNSSFFRVWGGKIPCKYVQLLRRWSFDCFIIHYHYCHQLQHPLPCLWRWQVLGSSSYRTYSTSKLSRLSYLPDIDEFLADLVLIILSIEVSGLANLLKP